jgi:hypothetical protein
MSDETWDQKLAAERWKIAHAEYRAEVSLGWDRQKTFFALNPTLTAVIAGFARTPQAAQVALVAAAIAALGGALVVRRSHGRYRAALAVVQRLEDQLGFADLQTTGGQREARGGLRLEKFRIVDVMAIAFVLNAVLDIVLAAMWR